VCFLTRALQTCVYFSVNVSQCELMLLPYVCSVGLSSVLSVNVSSSACDCFRVTASPNLPSVA